MKAKDDAGLESRRKFMKSVALTGGGVAVAAVSMGNASAAVPEPEDGAQVDKPTGYHETEHIRDYYAKAQF